jgi:hypothetical protein
MRTEPTVSISEVELAFGARWDVGMSKARTRESINEVKEG